ncbi:ornithine decarboxylase antizyme domain-containing protein [Ditylenchus destructor]|nr:ornithine decarboxylase antizyme domain-containing protein [Ditylenchus destructor]
MVFVVKELNTRVVRPRVIEGHPASCAAPDVPTSEHVDSDALAGLVKNVSEGWCWHMADKQTLALFVPSSQLSASTPTLSRDHFVELLEFCEEKLKVKRVVACFNKSDIDPRQGVPRALKCIGFTLLPPDHFPASIDKNSIFAMVYDI